MKPLASSASTVWSTEGGLTRKLRCMSASAGPLTLLICLGLFTVEIVACPIARRLPFEAGVPTARVVRIPHASPFVFLSHQADVLGGVNASLAGLK